MSDWLALGHRVIHDRAQGRQEAELFARAAAAHYRRHWPGFIRHVLGYQLTDFQRRWFQHQLEHRRSILLAPRGHGKSIICTISYVLWRIVNDPNVRILIASKTLAQASLLLGEIRNHIERNQVFRWLYGDLVGLLWRDDVITVRRSSLAKEPTVKAIGILGALPSWHFDVILIDDPHDLSNSATAGQREKVWRWLMQVCLPTLEPEGEIHVIGTRWHRDDVVGRLLATGPEYVLLLDPALDRDGNPLWPEKFPRPVLEEIRRKSPAAFQLQYMCSAEGVEYGTVFPYERFGVATEDAEVLRAHARYVVQAWDLAVGREELLGRGVPSEEGTLLGAGDYTAGVTVALMPDGRFVVLDWWRGRPTLAGQIKAIKDMAHKWEPDVIGVEAVAYQAVLARHLMRTTRLPIRALRPDRDKVRRAIAIQPYVEEGRVQLVQGVLPLREILAAFPFAEEDDSVDAFVYAMMLATRGLSTLEAGRVVEGI